MAAELRLRIGQFHKFSALKGWTTSTAKAQALGIDVSNLSRILASKQAVSSKFILGALRAFPELDFEDLFEVVDGDDMAAS